MTIAHPPGASPSRLRGLARPRLLTAAILVGGFLLLAFSTFIQDLGWLLWGAERVLKGGKFYRDFVEMNPPMILLLNLVPQEVADATGVNAVIAYDAFVTLILTVSLWVTRIIYRGSETAGDAPSWEWVLPTLLAGFVIIAVSFRSWGQRDVITAVLVLPYLALALERVHGRAVSRALMIAAALMCAIGIGIKPHFLLPLACIEGFVAQHVGPRKALVRPELVIVASTLAAYLALSIVVWPEYFRLMWGLGGAQAYGAFLAGRSRALLHFGTFYGVMAILLSLSAPAPAARRSLRSLLMWIVGGFALAAVTQQKGFDYHLVPTMIFATALFILTLSEGGARRRLSLLAASASLLLMLGKVGSRALRTARMVVTAPGTHLSHAIDVIETYAPHGNILGVSLHLAPFIPATTYADAEWGSAFSTVWPLLPAYEDQRTSDAPIHYHTRAEMPPLERYMFDRMIDDMIRRPPDLIVFRRDLTDELYGDGRFNYLKYFSQDERFRRFFGTYTRLPIDDPFIWYARAPVAQRPFVPPARRFGTRWSTNCYNCLE